jgi:hypothetical protein
MFIFILFLFLFLFFQMRQQINVIDSYTLDGWSECTTYTINILTRFPHVAPLDWP